MAQTHTKAFMKTKYENYKSLSRQPRFGRIRSKKSLEIMLDTNRSGTVYMNETNTGRTKAPMLAVRGSKSHITTIEDLSKVGKS